MHPGTVKEQSCISLARLPDGLQGLAQLFGVVRGETPYSAARVEDKATLGRRQLVA